MKTHHIYEKIEEEVDFLLDDMKVRIMSEVKRCMDDNIYVVPSHINISARWSSDPLHIEHHSGSINWVDKWVSRTVVPDKKEYN